MKHIIMTLTLVLLSASCLFSQDFYDIETINTIEITFVQSNWDQLLDDLYAAGDEERLVGTAIVNGVQFDSVGVRYKGNSSYSPNRIKNPLNIKLDHIIDDQELDGYGTLKLANVFKDPTFVRETLSYEIARKYMPASKANYANVYINGNYIGLYTSVQSVDKFFMSNHFNNNDNPFFKGEITNAGPPTESEVWGYYGPDPTSYYSYYELRSDEGWASLINMLDVLNNNPTNLETVLNVDRHLWMLAYDNLMVNLDSPINFAHNFYLYQDATGQFNPVLWDLNENFGVFVSLLSGGPPLNLTAMQHLNPFLNENNASYPIISQVLSNPSYRKMYIAHMKTIIADNFINDWYHIRALEIQDIIATHVQNDPNKFYTYSDFLNNIDTTIGGGGPPGPGNQSIVGITELMEERINYLITQPEFTAQAASISNVAWSPENISPNSQAWVTVEVTNADVVYIMSRHSRSVAFTAIQMHDDGNHNDGAANDHTYGVALNVGASSVDFYIYAENDDAGKFDPRRAAYEYYTIPVSAQVAINEFMASNDATVADQDGEFDDWLELYNNSDLEISLFGFHLSDDGQELDEWTFPDVSIAPHSFLVIWADDDEEQQGLHTNFKLSASGESIYLSDASLSIISEVSYGSQTTDISMGRFPDGTGEFMQMTPTFGAPNTNGSVSIEDNMNFMEIPFVLYQNYPNPFNPSTTISFSIPTASCVYVEVFNTAGQLVNTLVNDELKPDFYTVRWDGTNNNGTQVGSGVYLYTIRAGDYHSHKKMTLLK